MLKIGNGFIHTEMVNDIPVGVKGLSTEAQSLLHEIRHVIVVH
jgi:hypothetical protein